MSDIEVSFAVADDADAQFVLQSAFLVFFMQCGFAMLSAGSVRSKNAKNIILKNLLDACFGAIGFFLTGYGFAYGENAQPDGTFSNRAFLGSSGFALYQVPRSDYAFFFFQFTFAATAATIVSGAVAERTKFEGYLLYATFLTMWVYPIVAHWAWSSSGWASSFRSTNSGHKLLFDSGVVDFAGCGVVHMVGGFAGLAGAWAVGPRIGRYDESNNPRDIPGHNAALALLGVFILWFGWFGFNPGSALGISGLSSVAANCAVTTTMAAAGGTVSTLFAVLVHEKRRSGLIMWDVVRAGNGTLAGLVSITAATATVEAWAAIVIGFIGGLAYYGSSLLVAHVLKVDDPLDAIAVHGFCGMWGLIAAGLFSTEGLTNAAYGAGIHSEDGAGPSKSYGAFYGGGGSLLAANFVFMLCVLCWTLLNMIPFFLVCKKLTMLRVDPEEEEAGLDKTHHGGSAYHLEDSAEPTKYEVETFDTQAQISALRREIELLKAR